MSTGTILITGASQGLGAHIAERFASGGWDVIACGRREAPEVEQMERLRYVRADLGKDEDVSMLLSKLGGTPRAVIHNAVCYPETTGGAVPDVREMEAVFRVNAFVPYSLSLRLLESKRPDTPCSFVTINSESIYHADERSGLYAASKAALRVLTSALSSACRSKNASAATLLLGPLADPRKVEEIRAIAQKRGLSEAEVVKTFLRKTNPDLVIDEFIEFESCYEVLTVMINLGCAANGMVCKLDGGASGSLS